MDAQHEFAKGPEIWFIFSLESFGVEMPFMTYCK